MRDYEKIGSFFDISIENLVINELNKNNSIYEELSIFCNPCNDVKEKDYFKQIEENLLLSQKGDDFTINEIDTFIKYTSIDKEKYDFMDLINEIAKKYVKLSPEPHVDQCKIIEWREIVQTIGEDMFICSELAQKNHNATKEDFLWTPIIVSDDRRLRQILNQYVSENHNHLLGSAPIADLNWCAMHNNTSFWKFLNPKMFSQSHTPSSSFNDFKIRMIKAMIIRYYLFKKLKYENNTLIEVGEKLKKEKLFECIKTNSLSTLESYVNHNSLQPIKEFYKKNGVIKTYEDYAMSLYDNDNIWEGERSLLFKIFKAYKEFDREEKLLVYLYLIYRSYFYNQFIEKRKTPGFLQFARIEAYKEAFLDINPKYKDIMINSAIKATKACNIKNLEVRAAPKITKQKNKDYIKKIMINSTKAKSEMKGDYNWINNVYLGNPNNLSLLLPNTFVVFHFIKEGVENNIIKKDIIYERNHNVRKRVKKEAYALYEYLISNDEMSSLVLGIDAANREIGCRPEVMAQIFRYLRRIEYRDFDDSKKYRCLKGITYHVGEDFIDIPNGLRAIFEAILFLDIQPGDRLGHAIALGINPREYYELKKMDIYKSKQDILDDYVWMFFALNKLGNSKHETFKNSIKYKIQQLIREIYDYDGNNNYTLSDYYDAIKLRGDNPELYLNYFTSNSKDDLNEFYNNNYNYGGFSSYALNGHDKAKIARKNMKAIDLYYKYHYNLKARMEGDRIEHIKVDEDYIQAVEALQEYVKKEYILENRLVIEVNLTSNYVIGSYRGYKYSTLSSFNKYILDSSKKDNLQVCINTDDSGVFASNLYTEYSILLQVLTHPENSLDDTQKYDTEAVYDYINYLRKTSNVYSFINSNENDLAKIITKIIPSINKL